LTYNWFRSGTKTAVTPKVTGEPALGATLTADTTGWGPADVTFTYQWLRNGKSIKGKTAATYTTDVKADKAKSISVKVTGKLPGYTTVSKTSAKLKIGVLNTTTPKLVNVSTSKDPTKTAPVFGQTLGVDMAAWSPADTALTYNWFRSGTKTAVGSGTSYTIQPADVGKTIVVKATGTKAGYTTVTKASKASKKVAAAKQTAVTPKVAGEPALGATLTADTTGWGPAEVSFTYQWLRDGKTIKGKTAATYTTDAKADKAKSISVKVTGKLAGYTTVTKTSAKVKIGVLTTVTPKLVNVTTSKDPVKTAPKAGDTLSVTKGSWGPSSVTLTVEWYRSGVKNPVGTGDTYTLSSADVGKTIKVKVTGTKPGYTDAAKTSAASKKVSKA
jgi:HSP20 family molecular chaperone IbpA